MNDFLLQLSTLLNADQIILPHQNTITPFINEYRGNFISNPIAVILPSNTNQVAEIVKLCNIHNIGIVPQGGNSGLVGGSVAKTNQIILSSKLMNKIINVEPKNYSATLQAGVKLLDIHQYLDSYDLFFPLDLASKDICTIGGNVATNAGGINVLKYGLTKDLILGIEAVLPDGQIYNDLNLLRKRNIGSDFKNLFIASEGLLGFITQLNIKLFNKPKSFINICFGANNLSNLEDVFHSVKYTFNDALNAYEIFNNNCMDITKKYYPNINVPIETNNPWYCIFSLESIYDNNSSFNLDSIEKLKNIFLTHQITNNYVSEKKDMWDIRYNLPNSQKKLGQSLKHDISLPLHKLVITMQELESQLKQAYPHLIPTIFGHWGDGNLHYNIASPNQLELDLHKSQIKDIIIEIVLKNEGTFSAEHGIGLLHKEEFKNYYSNNQYNGLKLIKTLLDKNNIFNKDKVF